MTDDDRTTEDTAPRAAWEHPELRRIDATEAEAVGASGNDGVIGTS
ncbi:MAG: hypothetical protein ACXW3O_10200 [Brevundimonas sp.]